MFLNVTIELYIVSKRTSVSDSILYILPQRVKPKPIVNCIQGKHKEWLWHCMHWLSHYPLCTIRSIILFLKRQHHYMPPFRNLVLQNAVLHWLPFGIKISLPALWWDTVGHHALTEEQSAGTFQASSNFTLNMSWGELLATATSFRKVPIWKVPGFPTNHSNQHSRTR